MMDDPMRVCTSCMWIGVRVPATHIVEYEYGLGQQGKRDDDGLRDFCRGYAMQSFACAECARKYVAGLPRNQGDVDREEEIYTIYGYKRTPWESGARHAIPIDIFWEWVRESTWIDSIIADKHYELELAAESINRLKGAKL